jgi:hypothetical protein
MNISIISGHRSRAIDPIKNPYSPGAGTPPPELVGRDPIIHQSEILLGRVQAGKPEKSLLLTGLRGVGKTVLLNEIERRALEKGYRTIFIEAHENKPLGPLLAPHLRKLLYNLNLIANVSNKAKRALAVFRSFIGALKVTYEDVSIGLDIDPEIGSADSGDLEVDLPDLFVAIGEAAADRKCSIAIFVDEVQYLTKKELGALIMAMHKLQQKQLPMLLLGAGLPVLPGLAGDSKSYAERLFNFPYVGALSKTESEKALQEPAKAESVTFDQAAIEEIYKLTQGYPYFLQEWGYLAWNTAQSSPIMLDTVKNATEEAINRLDENFFRVRFDRLVPSEKNFLRAMAELGPGEQKIGDIADIMKVQTGSLSPRRAKLIQKGMIYSPSHGNISFTVPLFDQFMTRAIPDFPINS